MDQYNSNEQLIQEMRDCASLLRQYANDESLLNKTAGVHSSAGVNTQKSEYMQGFMHGFGLD